MVENVEGRQENSLTELDVGPGGSFFSSCYQQRRRSLSQRLLLDSRTQGVLLSIDLQLAEATRERGCPCGGALHVANFWRKPRGAGAIEDPRFEQRFSFCCSRDGCRSRTTPASARFLDQRVYVGAVVVLVAALREGPTPTRMSVLRRELGVDARTVQRWQIYWREEFPRLPSAVLMRSRWVGVEGLSPAALLEWSRSRGDEDPVVVVLREIAACKSLVTQSGHAA